jgi:hypothetical protein
VNDPSEEIGPPLDRRTHNHCNRARRDSKSRGRTDRRRGQSPRCQPDRVFLLIGLLTFASGLLTIVVLFIRYIVNYAKLTSVELDEAITRG